MPGEWPKKMAKIQKKIMHNVNTYWICSEKVPNFKDKKRKVLIWLVSMYGEKRFFHRNKYLWLVNQRLWYGGSHMRSIVNRDTDCSLSSKASGICLTARSCTLEQKGCFYLFIFYFSGIKEFILYIKSKPLLKLKNKLEDLVTVKIYLL